MNDLDQARNLVITLQKTLDNMAHHAELKLTKTEIDRLHKLSQNNPDKPVTIKTIPTGIGAAVIVSFNGGASHDISDYESW